MVSATSRSAGVPKYPASADAHILAASYGRFAKLPAGGFSRRLRLDGERVDGALEFRRKRRIYHTMAFDPALPFEGRRYDIDPEMRLAARPVARMALMQMRFVRDVEAFRQESFTQLVYDSVFGAHDNGR
jgi:hypothetical protein